MTDPNRNRTFITLRADEVGPADEQARKEGLSRSGLYQKAVRYYLDVCQGRAVDMQVVMLEYPADNGVAQPDCAPQNPGDQA